MNFPKIVPPPLAAGRRMITEIWPSFGRMAPATGDGGGAFGLGPFKGLHRLLVHQLSNLLLRKGNQDMTSEAKVTETNANRFSQTPNILPLPNNAQNLPNGMIGANTSFPM